MCLKVIVTLYAQTERLPKQYNFSSGSEAIRRPFRPFQVKSIVWMLLDVLECVNLYKPCLCIVILLQKSKQCAVLACLDKSQLTNFRLALFLKTDRALLGRLLVLANVSIFACIGENIQHIGQTNFNFIEAHVFLRNID